MRNLLLFLCFLFFTFCSDDTNKNNITEPEIEWIAGGTTTTFSYSSGVVSGFTFHRQFNALASGDVNIDVQVKGDNETKVSGNYSIETGKKYNVSISASKSGSQLSNPGSTCLTIEFSSPNSVSKQDINVSSYLVPSYNEYVGDQYYCPKSLILGEVVISE
ncbi:MAG: hypothetical protein GXO79_06550 [Chlorobi bacterium]|nr:hypothetical protein [Chlorobiota bacterium]